MSKKTRISHEPNKLKNIGHSRLKKNMNEFDELAKATNPFSQSVEKTISAFLRRPEDAEYEEEEEGGLRLKIRRRRIPQEHQKL